MTGHLLCRNIQSTYTLCTINHIFGTCVEQIVTLQSYEWGIIMFYACCFRSPKRCVMFHVDETSVHNCRKFNCENELYWNYKVLLPTTKQNEYTTFVETDMFSILREISDFWVAWTRDLFYRQMYMREIWICKRELTTVGELFFYYVETTLFFYTCIKLHK